MKRSVTFIAALLLAVATLHAASDWPSIYGPRRDTPPSRKACCARGRRQGRRCCGRCRWPRVSAAPRSGMARSTSSTGTRRLATSCACSTWRPAKSSGHTPMPLPGSFMFAGSRTTPTLDGDLVYTVGPMGDLFAISITTQKPAWRKNIWKDFGGGTELPQWAITQNPLI